LLDRIDSVPREKGKRKMGIKRGKIEKDRERERSREIERDRERD